jgi:nucleotide-binding universal stress UspA family protein
MPHTDKAVEYAIDYAFRYRAALFVLCVLSPGERRAAYADGKEAVETVKLKALSNEVGVTTMLESGEPAETIVRVAGKISADTIIMGASGRCEEGRRRPLGSVSGKTAQDACCSVIIVR